MKQRIKKNGNRIRWCSIILFSAFFLSGCSEIGFYWQAAMGHLDLLNRKQDITTLIESPQTSPQLKRKLQVVESVRQFAIQEMQLPDQGGYTGYTDLGRNYVTMVVTAAPRFELKAHQWCYLFVGCQEYRGYFDEDEARQLGKQLEAEKLDVSVRPVSAYSTLGWLNKAWIPDYFSDPVLNTFLNRHDVELMSTLIHEMAHQVVYIKNDTAFNESFAVFVEQEGLRQYLEQNRDSELFETSGDELFERYLKAKQDQQLFFQMLRKTYERLKKLYETEISESKKLHEKEIIFQKLKEEFQSRRSEFQILAYQHWFSKPLNNTHLLSVRRYHGQLPIFEKLFEKSNRNWGHFFEAVIQYAEQRQTP